MVRGGRTCLGRPEGRYGVVGGGEGGRDTNVGDGGTGIPYDSVEVLPRTRESCRRVGLRISGSN